MSRCNFCTLRLMRRRAKQDGEVVTLVRRVAANVWGGGGWIDAFVHCPDVRIIEHKHFAASFLELPEKCVC